METKVCLLPIIAVLLLLACSASVPKESEEIFLLEVTSLCVNINPNLDTTKYFIPAASFVLTGSDLVDGRQYYFENQSFIVTVLTKTFQTGEIPLRAGAVRIDDAGEKMLKLYLEKQQIRHLFDDGYRHEDDCYEVELANMIAQGKVFYKVKGTKQEVLKSPIYDFHIGARGD